VQVYRTCFMIIIKFPVSVSIECSGFSLVQWVCFLPLCRGIHRCSRRSKHLWHSRLLGLEWLQPPRSFINYLSSYILSALVEKFLNTLPSPPLPYPTLPYPLAKNLPVRGVSYFYLTYNKQTNKQTNKNPNSWFYLPFLSTAFFKVMQVTAFVWKYTLNVWFFSSPSFS